MGHLTLTDKNISDLIKTLRQYLIDIHSPLVRDIGKELQLAGLKRCRETLPRRNAECKWNDLEIAADCKDTPIRRGGGNQHLRNEGPPCAAMTDPSRRQIDRTKIRGHPTPTGRCPARTG
jgi:hypothetical protein